MWVEQYDCRSLEMASIVVGKSRFEVRLQKAMYSRNLLNVIQWRETFCYGPR